MPHAARRPWAWLIFDVRQRMRFRLPEDLIPGGKNMTAKDQYRWKKKWNALMWQNPRYRWTFITCLLMFSFAGFLVLSPLLLSDSRGSQEKILLPIWILAMSAFGAHFVQMLASRA